MKTIINYIADTLVLTIVGLGIAAVAALVALFAPLLALMAIDTD